MNEESLEFCNEYRMREVIEKYCSFMPVNIYLSKANAEQEYETIDEEIAKLEEKDKQLDNEMALPENATDVAKLQELTKEKESISARLEELYEKWETLEAL